MLLELSMHSYTVYTQHHVLAARNRIDDCYGSLLLDLQHAGFSVDLVTVEVGCLGHFMPVTVTKLSNICHLLSRQFMLPSPVRTGHLTLGLQHHGI